MGPNLYPDGLVSNVRELLDQVHPESGRIIEMIGHKDVNLKLILSGLETLYD
jgi:hypothetical protein